MRVGRRELPTKRLTDTTPRAVPHHGATDRSRGNERDASRRSIAWEDVRDEGRPSQGAPARAYRRDVAGTPQTCGAHHLARDQTTVMRLRPRARRVASTLRPPVVFMRARKPCTRARRRVFGWYVRFTIESLLPGERCGRAQRCDQGVCVAVSLHGVTCVRSSHGCPPI